MHARGFSSSISRCTTETHENGVTQSSVSSTDETTSASVSISSVSNTQFDDSKQSKPVDELSTSESQDSISVAEEFRAGTGFHLTATQSSSTSQYYDVSSVLKPTDGHVRMSGSHPRPPLSTPHHMKLQSAYYAANGEEPENTNVTRE